MKKISKLFLPIIFIASFLICFSVNTLAVNLSSYIWIDYPASGLKINYSDVEVKGWALNGSGVKEVNIYLDNKEIGQATYGGYRPDVNKALPGYTSANYSGYNYTIKKENISSGKHQVKVMAVGNDGIVTAQTKDFYMIKKQSYLWVDSPANLSQILYNDMEVRGWALNDSGIKQVDIYLNNSLLGQANYGELRTDVNKALPGYSSGDNCGYTYLISKNNLTAGSNTIKITVTGLDNTVMTETRNFTVIKLENHIWLDLPSEGAQIKDEDITVRGWALNVSGMNQVDVYIDGSLSGKADYGSSRQDVYRFYPDYSCGANSGYGYIIDKDTVAPGNHIIKVVAEGNDGTSQEASKSFTMVKKSSHTWIDTPIDKGNIFNSNINIKGWALNPSRVSQIDVVLDGKVVGQATYGLLRKDVNLIAPGYPSGDYSGYQYTIYSSDVTDGWHNIDINVKGSDGTSCISSRTVYFKLLPNKVTLETPINNFVSDNKDIDVTGYALIPAGIKNIEIDVDGIKKGNCTYGVYRSDIGSLYSGYPESDYSGYSFKIEADKFMPGTHSLTIKVYGADDTITTKNASFTLDKANPQMFIDSPVSTQTYYMEDINVRGWVLNPSGVKTVNVYLNDVLQGTVATGLSRPDVNRVYPDYRNSLNCGYNYIISKNFLSTGSYTVKVVQIGYDGTTLSLTKSITVDMDKVTTVMSQYSYTFGTILLKQILASPQIWKTGFSWTDASPDEVSYYLNPNNFINDDVSKYQFLVLNYSPGITADEINTILSGKGALDGYGSSFLNSALANNVSLPYAVAHSLLETGNGTSMLANGVLVSKVDGVAVTPRIVYNMFGIGAKDSEPVRLGAEYAYNQGWFSKKDAIEGGIKWISGYYINNSYYKQNTLYKMRWNPSNTGPYAAHQYATDVRWADSQTDTLKKCMDLYPNVKLIYDIPNYMQ